VSEALSVSQGISSAVSGVREPLAVDLCCGLGGWTEGLLAEGYRVRGYDIEAHEYGDEKYPAELVLKSILDLHGSEVADADLIVASPPCQEYSYMAMPWSLAKAKAAAIRADETGEALKLLTALFDACFRIQREANAIRAAMGLPPVPMVVENVRGAQPWVGQAAWNYGSYYLWGDVPALMPAVVGGRKVPGFRFDGSGGSFQTASVEQHALEGRKNGGGSWFNIGSPGQKETGQNPVHRIAKEGVKNPGRSLSRGAPKFNDRIANFPPEIAEGRKGAGAGAEWFDQNLCKLSSKSSARKAASAKIAKIPLALSSHIARVYLPRRAAA
jgi:hypothetical protein